MSTIFFTEWQDRIIDDPAPMALAKEFQRRGASRGYFLMPEQLRNNDGFFGTLKEALGDSIAGVYDRLPQHSPLPDVFGAAREAQALGCDVLVSIGGGSNIDAAKLIQYCLTLGEFEMDAVLASRADKARSRKRGTVQHVCVPTTLSGAEFTYFAGGRNPATMLKEAFVAPDVLPRTLVLDQQLATSTPQNLWLSSGLRAMDHAIEGVISGKNHPMGYSLGIEGIARLRRGLAATHADPQDLEARRTSQYGGWFCAVGLMTGVPMGASHAIGHVIGSVYDIPHGLTSCIGLPAVMQYNYRANDPAFDEIARALGGTQGHEAPDLLRRFIASLDLPTTMTELGLGRETFQTIAEGTLHEGWAGTNPVPLKNAEDVVRILELML